MKYTKTVKDIFSKDNKHKGVPETLTITKEEPKGDFMIITGTSTVRGEEILFKFLKRVSVEKADFLLREVSRKIGDGEEGPFYGPIWSHTMVRIPKALNRLALIDGQLIIVVTARGYDYRDVVKQVFPIEGLLTATPVTADDEEVTFFGAGMNSSVTLALKKKIAREYGVCFDKTPAEDTFARAASQFEQEDDEAKKTAKMQARKYLRKTFVARPKRTAYNISGRPLYGIVLSSEENWSVLDDNTPVIIEKDGTPIEFFFVSKKIGGSYDKRGIQTNLSWERPKPAVTTNAFKVERFTVVRISTKQADFLSKKGIDVAPGAMEVAVVPKSHLSVMRKEIGNRAVFQLVDQKNLTQLVCTAEGSVYTIPA